MRDRALRALALSIVLAAAAPSAAAAAGPGVTAAPPRKVLVELYSSQGCDSCPPASDLLGELQALGYGPDRVVPLNFHIGDFNGPWRDPFSDPAFARRRVAYNDVLRRNDLSFTPLMMVDGKDPVLGSDRAKALAALRQARKEPAGVELGLGLDGQGARKTLTVKLAALAPAAAGRDLLVGAALTEDPVTTKVLGGENRGKTLVEHHVVRRLDRQFVTLERTGTRSLSFPVELGPGCDPAHVRLAVFVQDRGNGKVYQADALPWTRPQTPGASRAREFDRLIARRKARRAAWVATSRPGFDPFLAATADPQASQDGPFPTDPSDDPGTTCPACGSSVPPPTGPIAQYPGQVLPRPALVPC